MTVPTLPRYTCKRCSHNWVPRLDAAPRVCPACKSPYWDKERRNNRNSAGRREGAADAAS